MPEEESEEGFVFRDRRRAQTPEASAPSVPAEIAEPEGEVYDDLAMEGEGDAEQMGSLPDVYSVLALFLQELRSLAWLRMGLVANPSTGQIERDLDQARIAIDTVEFLAKQLEPAVAPEERLPLKALVSDLQINFVEQSKRP
ncbi:MAG: DUF1844 domain-containing protein [Akkermansiaceae bacterium]|nr:DUF1844 domain-containing protein [Armatimonadota bacterium]